MFAAQRGEQICGQGSYDVVARPRIFPRRKLDDFRSRNSPGSNHHFYRWIDSHLQSIFPAQKEGAAVVNTFNAQEIAVN
jgi:hypothetical protein